MYSSTLSLPSALNGAWWSAPRLGRCTPGKETQYSLYRTLGGPQGRCGRVRKITPTTGIRSPDLLCRSESLYRLSYPGPWNCVSSPNRAGTVSVWECEGRERRVPDYGSCYQEGTDVLSVWQKVCADVSRNESLFAGYWE